MNGPNLSLEKLIQIVSTVGQQLLDLRARQQFDGHWEGTQFKAEADLRANESICALLKKLSPETPIISEEDADSQGDSRPDRYFLIDPIDGTGSFVKNFTGFVTQVALVERNEPLLAAICAPALNLVYSAEKSRGASLNGRRLKVNDIFRPKTLIDNYPEPRGSALDLFRQLKFEKYVESGSISLKICRVADSTASAFFKDVTIRDWDIAPAQLILEEAGGAFSTLDGKKFPYHGTYEHTGLVAAHSVEAATEVIEWQKARRSTG